ncbi:acyltransferase family protein [Aquabacter spiritensis]|uniref:Peptidoglycan/LPS O-acetylase OafA/YrhL n=1 Tax=Aquabacter spiritensis TaxID=933073 RepID=A0A4R3M3X6_9HYPH|nr:acyltransferase [Aquabacter spiritensis]TCT07742.1 peptidoglycan/LPS O-acetylase OafA/YrhL [Aquabacter spiritensis]
MFQTVQACRAVAALSVVLFHAFAALSAEKYGGLRILGGFPAAGDLGVDFFFVISGFVILYAHRADIGAPARLKRYVWRRFRRIYPVYWLFHTVLLLAILAGASADAHFSALDLLTSYSLVRVSPTNTAVATAWSLFNEVFFYAVFAVLIVNRRLGLALFGAWILAVIAASPFNPSATTFAGVALNLMNLNFALGIAVYFGLQRIAPRYGPVMTLGSLAVLLLCLVFLEGGGLREGNVFVRAAFGLPFAGVLLGLLLWERAGLARVPGWLTFLGDASYTIYLTHFALVSLMAKVGLLLGLPTLLPPLLYWLAMSAAAVAGGALLYVLIEKPLLHRVRRVGGGRPGLPADAAAP